MDLHGCLQGQLKERVGLTACFTCASWRRSSSASFPQVMTSSSLPLMASFRLRCSR